MKETNFTVTTKKIELKLTKETPGVQWQGVEKGSASGVNVIPSTQPSAMPSYPSSSKKKANFNQLDKEIERELENDKPEGDQALNGLFKQIYERADPETRRAMIKSY